MPSAAIRGAIVAAALAGATATPISPLAQEQDAGTGIRLVRTASDAGTVYYRLGCPGGGISQIVVRGAPEDQVPNVCIRPRGEAERCELGGDLKALAVEACEKADAAES